MKKYLFYILLLSQLLNVAQAQNSDLQKKLDGILKNQKNHSIGVHVVDVNTGKEAYSFRGSELMKPASTMKIVTSVTALEKLGPHHTFKTKMILKKSEQGGTDLYVRGLGDPSLTTEALWLIARNVKKYGISKLNQLYVDDSAFLSPPKRDGQRAYMAAASALPLNYNSLAIQVCPTSPSQPAVVESDPWEVPVLISSQVKTSARSASAIQVEEETPKSKNIFASYKVSGVINADDSCQSIYRSVDDSTPYFAQTLQNFLEYLGIKVNGTFKRKSAVNENGIVFFHESQNLSSILRGLNHFSTNFIAEQILYALGEKNDGEYFDRNVGLSEIENFLMERGLHKDNFGIFDGSGLSHDNRLSPRVLTTLLDYAYHKPRYSSDFLASLPAAGYTGTMRKRYPAPSNAEIRAKTGSLNGVISLAGYILKSDGKRLAFAILQNDVQSKEFAMELEESLIQALSNN